jgi:hypothetical protein
MFLGSKERPVNSAEYLAAICEPKIRQIRQRNVSDEEARLPPEPWALLLCLGGANVSRKGETIWKVMSIGLPIAATTGPKIQEAVTLVCAGRSQTIDEVAQQGSAMIILPHNCV